MQPEMRAFLRVGLSYPGNEFRAGVHVGHLVLVAPMLHALLTLDRRGGIFKQQDVESALLYLWRSQELAASAVAPATRTFRSLQQLAKDESYLIRCMLSHVRAKRHDFQSCVARGSQSKDPEPLLELYVLVNDDDSKNGPVLATRRRR
jgi:hypothetical protein